MVRKLSRVAAMLPLVLVCVAFAAPAAQASGSAVVTNCSNDTQLTADIAAGDSITFNCGVATIVLSDTEVVTNNVVINGGDKITLSGANNHELFETGLGSSLDLRHIVLKKGHDVSNGGAINSEGFLALENATIT